MNLVHELRVRAGMQQKEVAIAVGVSRPTVSEWEHGKKDPSGDRVLKLAELFGVDPAIILGYKIGEADITPHASSNAIRVPVLGTIPAGIPIEAIQDVLDWEELPAEMGKGGKEYFGLRVQGDSMYPRYEDGDVIILRRQETCESGQDCAVMVNNDDATFKRVRINNDGITLVPINPAYEPRFFTCKQVAELPVRILGVVVQLRRDI